MTEQVFPPLQPYTPMNLNEIRELPTNLATPNVRLKVQEVLDNIPTGKTVAGVIFAEVKNGKVVPGLATYINFGKGFSFYTKAKYNGGLEGEAGLLFVR